MWLGIKSNRNAQGLWNRLQNVPLTSRPHLPPTSALKRHPRLTSRTHEWDLILIKGLWDTVVKDGNRRMWSWINQWALDPVTMSWKRRTEDRHTGDAALCPRRQSWLMRALGTNQGIPASSWREKSKSPQKTLLQRLDNTALKIF